MKEYEQTRCHLEAVIGSLHVKAVKQTRCESLHLEAVNWSLPVKATKTIGSLYFGGSWPVESLQFKGTWVPLRVSTVLRWSRIELTPRLNYPRTVKFKES